MYLSRLILNPLSRRVQNEMASPYEMHRTLARCVGEREADGERLLFRLEPAPYRGGLQVLLQSRERPDWSWLEEPGARGYLLPGLPDNPACKPFAPEFSVGQVLAFRLRANPTVKRTFVEGAERAKKRIGVTGEEAQLEWLQRKGDEGGFNLVAAQALEDGMVGAFLPRRDRRGEATGRCHASWLAVIFEGRLQVRDPYALLGTLERGVGSGKAFGFGLLSLAPVMG